MCNSCPLEEHRCSCSACSGHDHGHEHETSGGERRELLLMGVSAVLFAAGMLADTRLEAFLPSWLVLTLCYVLPYALCGYDVLRQMLRNIMRGDIFNEFTLMGGATIAAIALGQLPEAVGVMLFYRIGEFMQERAAGNSRRSVKALLAARPTTAHELLDDGATRDVSPEDLGPGSRILVRPGEKIPLDGTVLEGESQVDASPLTGESVPVRLSPGGQVHAGTINLNGALTVEVTAPFAESSIARILEMVENAAARKAPTERFITRLARWYTPAVSGLALLVAVLPPLFGLGSFQEWIYRALVLLVISCPCALLISIPLGYFGGIGAASRRGILIKGGAVLDNLRDIRVAAFDKTGTLTEGVFEVNAVLPMPGVSREELLSVAALAESRSNHPIARSVLRAALAAGLGTEKDAAVSAMREIPGKGVEVTADGAQVLAGNAALLEAYNITPLPVDMPGSVEQVARDGRALGALVVSDRIKPQAPGALEALRQPLEDGFVSVVRVSAQAKYPARAMFVAAMNPCPCGNYGSSTQPCRCTQKEIARYLGRISGPLLDRIDMQLEVTAVPVRQITESAPEEPSEAIHARVQAARRRQQARYAGEGVSSNAELSARQLEQFCPLDDACRELIGKACDKYNLSMRAVSRVRKVARTIADLAGEENIGKAHILEALRYRNLEGIYWK